MLSESQERMIVVVEAGREKEVLDIFHHWELDAVKIGEVIEGKNVELRWHGEVVSSMPVSVLTSSVPQYRWPEAQPADYEQKISARVEIEPCANLDEVWMEFLGSVNGCSRRPVFNQYDSTVRSNTVVHPGGDAAVIRIKGGRSKKEKGVAMTLDCNSRYCELDPRHGTALSLAEACRNIAAVGAEPIGLSDCLNFASPERPEGMWEIAESIRGLGEAARAFGVPVVSGNVSLYNETIGKPILPTPTIALVGLIDDASKCVGSQFLDDNDRILVLGETNPNELGGSEFLAFHSNFERGALPNLNYDREIATANLVRELISKRLLKSCHDISSGGLGAAFAECCFGTYSAIGATLEAEPLIDVKASREGYLFSESGARYIVSLLPEQEKKVRDLARKKGVPVAFAGSVGGDMVSIKDVASFRLEQGYLGWQNGLTKMMP